VGEKMFELLALVHVQHLPEHVHLLSIADHNSHAATGDNSLTTHKLNLVGGTNEVYNR